MAETISKNPEVVKHPELLAKIEDLVADKIEALGLPVDDTTIAHLKMLRVTRNFKMRSRNFEDFIHASDMIEINPIQHENKYRVCARGKNMAQEEGHLDEAMYVDLQGNVEFSGGRHMTDRSAVFNVMDAIDKMLDNDGGNSLHPTIASHTTVTFSD